MAHSIPARYLAEWAVVELTGSGTIDAGLERSIEGRVIRSGQQLELGGRTFQCSCYYASSAAHSLPPLCQAAREQRSGVVGAATRIFFVEEASQRTTKQLRPPPLDAFGAASRQLATLAGLAFTSQAPFCQKVCRKSRVESFLSKDAFRDVCCLGHPYSRCFFEGNLS